ncbi:MAG: glycosyltransferase family 4 protein [Nitrososphaeria archaeon]
MSITIVSVELMKLLELSWEFYPSLVGGLGTYASEICRQFVKLGTDVTVLTINRGDLKKREIWQGIDVHRPIIVNTEDFFGSIVSEELTGWGGRGIEFFSNIISYNILSASKAANDLVRLEGMEFDLIVSHDWLSIPGGLSLKRELNLPLVFHVHSTEHGRSLGNPSRTVQQLELIGAKRADLVVTVSCAMKEEISTIGFPPEKIKVIYNGVDEEKYRSSNVATERVKEIREQYAVREDEIMILFIGRLVPVKGVDKLVQSMAYVKSKFPSAKLLVIGLGDLQEHLKNLVRQYSLEKEVRLRYEFIGEEERVEHYAACDVTVFPSLYEPFGIVALEAMSMEKPVVVGARGTSGLREIVIPNGENQCGYHVNPYDPADIAWGINSLLVDRENMKRLGKNGRSRVLEKFTWSAIATETLGAYQELLQSSR